MTDSITTTKETGTSHRAGCRQPSGPRVLARFATCSSARSKTDTVGGTVAAGDPEVPRNWDELASKLERKFRALLKELDAMRAELEDAKRRARQLDHRLLREVLWNG